MKILLDESLPRKLRDDFETVHEVLTVRDKAKATAVKKYLDNFTLTGVRLPGR